MASTSSGQRQRSSKNKDKVHDVEFADLVSQLSCRRLRKDKSDIEQISDFLSEVSISESMNFSSRKKRQLTRMLLPHINAMKVAIRQRSLEVEEEKQEKESSSEMPISDFRAVASQKKPEKKVRFTLGLKDLENLRDLCKDPRAPELVEKDPDGKLFPFDFKQDSNGFYEVPPGFTCEVCGSSQHWRTLCPYLHKFPPDGKIKNKEAYLVVCRCGNPVVDLSRQSCDNCVSGRGCHVVHKYYPIFGDSTYSEHLPSVHATT